MPIITTIGPASMRKFGFGSTESPYWWTYMADVTDGGNNPSINIDSADNLTIMYMWSNSAQVGVVTKLNKYGKQLWNKQFDVQVAYAGAGRVQIGTTIVTDTSDNIYIPGTPYYDVCYGAIGGWWKIDTNGSPVSQWRKSSISGFSSAPSLIAYNNSTSLLINGIDSLAIQINNYNVTGASPSNISGKGYYKYSTPIPSVLMIDPTNTYYYVVQTEQAYIGCDIYPVPTIYKAALSDATLSWFKNIGPSPPGANTAMPGSSFNAGCVDSSGNIYLAGKYFDNASNWGPYVMKLTDAGAITWQKYLKSGSDYGFTSICVDNSGNVYCAGEQGIIAKYNSSGILQWQRTFSINSPYESNVKIVLSRDQTVLNITKQTYISGKFAVLIGRIPVNGSLTGTYGSLTYSTAALTDTTPTYSIANAISPSSFSGLTGYSVSNISASTGTTGTKYLATKTSIQ